MRRIHSSNNVSDDSQGGTPHTSVPSPEHSHGGQGKQSANGRAIQPQDQLLRLLVMLVAVLIVMTTLLTLSVGLDVYDRVYSKREGAALVTPGQPPITVNCTYVPPVCPGSGLGEGQQQRREQGAIEDGAPERAASAGSGAGPEEKEEEVKMEEKETEKEMEMEKEKEKEKKPPKPLPKKKAMVLSSHPLEALRLDLSPYIPSDLDVFGGEIMDKSSIIISKNGTDTVESVTGDVCALLEQYDHVILVMMDSHTNFNRSPFADVKCAGHCNWRRLKNPSVILVDMACSTIVTGVTKIKPRFEITEAMCRASESHRRKAFDAFLAVKQSSTHNNAPVVDFLSKGVSKKENEV